MVARPVTFRSLEVTNEAFGLKGDIVRASADCHMRREMRDSARRACAEEFASFEDGGRNAGKGEGGSGVDILEELGVDIHIAAGRIGHEIWEGRVVADDADVVVWRDNIAFLYLRFEADLRGPEDVMTSAAHADPERDSSTLDLGWNMF
ncbi:hypothetical protein M408DRAFT_333914 [Serendipita vermifera MAFF 305830]|uniref:Uncharacterized protein n=1 Tax=Serendipita vermifera MAFF 305830 TaxID=933852 RepID=A0A0C3AKL5_SERVB|nr:hypothetical protein M408DRAFT_333914 [Serendipita vermifera MAFF 305830]